MKVCIALLSFILVASAQRYINEYPDAPIPYSFSYTAPGEEGQSSHQESGDGNGRVQGSYSLQDVDGRFRVVEYVADEYGFRANIRTNEPGTANQNPADVTIESSADQGGVPQVAPRPQYRVPTPVVRRPQTQAGRYVLVPVDAAGGGFGGYY